MHEYANIKPEDITDLMKVCTTCVTKSNSLFHCSLILFTLGCANKAIRGFFFFLHSFIDIFVLEGGES